MPSSQHEQDGPNLLHTLTVSGTLLSVSIASKFCQYHFWVIGPSCFHMVAARFVQPTGSDLARNPLSRVSLHHGRGRELKCVAIVPWQYSLLLLSSW